MLENQEKHPPHANDRRMRLSCTNKPMHRPFAINSRVSARSGRTTTISYPNPAAFGLIAFPIDYQLSSLDNQRVEAFLTSVSEMYNWYIRDQVSAAKTPAYAVTDL
jgi:hypothetical protein